MPLVHKNNTAVYSGVSTQAVDLRPESFSEEMVNCYPTVAHGVRRRNPTSQINDSILAEDNQFMHTYDRGLSGETSEQYVITIDNVNKLRVFDVVENEYATVIYDGSSLAYLTSSNPEVGFAAITIKDSTFIANKDISPLREGELASAINHTSLTFATSSYSIPKLTGWWIVGNSTATGLAPAKVAVYKYATYRASSAIGATTTITVDGVAMRYITKVKTDAFNILPETLAEYRANIANMIKAKLGSGYTTVFTTDGKILVHKLDGTATVTTVAMAAPTRTPPRPPIAVRASQYVLESINNYTTSPITISYGSATEIVGLVSSDYDKIAHIWIKQVSPDTTFPYTFTVSLKEANGTNIATTTTAATSTTGVASAIQTWANGLADFTAVVDGSIVKISRNSGAEFSVVLADTYGNQAAEAFKGTVTSMQDLPKSFPFKDTIIQVSGVDKLDNISYWVKYDGNKWIEHRDPRMLWKVKDSTMPHQLVRNANGTFTFKQVDYADILVGDTDSQPIPEFFGDEIRDLFFVNGRFGILSKNGITLSQYGNFSNFFRTTVLNLLDDSAITTYIDSSRSVGLEYAAELQGSIILFGDKLQFLLDASKPISPSTVSVQPISGFEINKNVKPVSVGDSIFFLVSNGSFSSLMEMNRSTISSTVRADDVSVHVPHYIDPDIMQLIPSQRDNAVLLRSRAMKDTLYVYKYYGTETEKIQQAWSKWTFNMDIKSAFVFDKELYLFGLRLDSTVPLDQFSLASVWDDTKLWDDTTYWSDGDVLATPSFEKMYIESYTTDSTFLDLGTIRYDSEIVLSEWSLDDKRSGIKESRGHLLMKTAQIVSSEGSEFFLVVDDKERNTSRVIPSVYTVDRKPFISGKAENTRIRILSSNGVGFQINAISLEGQYNVRSKRV